VIYVKKITIYTLPHIYLKSNYFIWAFWVKFRAVICCYLKNAYLSENILRNGYEKCSRKYSSLRIWSNECLNSKFNPNTTIQELRNAILLRGPLDNRRQPMRLNAIEYKLFTFSTWTDEFRVQNCFRNIVSKGKHLWHARQLSDARRLFDMRVQHGLRRGRYHMHAVRRMCVGLKLRYEREVHVQRDQLHI